MSRWDIYRSLPSLQINFKAAIRNRSRGSQTALNTFLADPITRRTRDRLSPLSASLLNDMGQLMGRQRIFAGRLAGSEIDVRPMRESFGVQTLAHLHGVAAGVDAHVTK